MLAESNSLHVGAVREDPVGAEALWRILPGHRRNNSTAHFLSSFLDLGCWMVVVMGARCSLDAVRVGGGLIKMLF